MKGRVGSVMVEERKSSEHETGDIVPVVLVSACLLGKPCRYDGESRPCEKAIALAQGNTARCCRVVSICPETAGGLPIPRCPSEIDTSAVGLRVVGEDGSDRTAAFEKGAEAAVNTARQTGAKHAVLKSKSPACGVGHIFDGTFSATLVEGDGVATCRLRSAGVQVVDENHIDELSL